MPRDPSDPAAVFDMLQAAGGLLRYTAGKSRDDYERDDYERDELLRAAVERKMEIIGEAARRLTKAFRDKHPHVPWRVIMATRHILAHDYDEVDNDIVWRIVTEHIPALIGQLAPLIPSHHPNQE